MSMVFNILYGDFPMLDLPGVKPAKSGPKRQFRPYRTNIGSLEGKSQSVKVAYFDCAEST